MATGISFGSVLKGLSMLDKNNANNAAAMDRQKAGDDSAMQRLIKGDEGQMQRLLKSIEAAADQSALARGQRTYESNLDWARDVERQWGRDEFSREQDARRQSQQMEQLAKEQEFAAGAPERAMKARLAEEEAENNRRLLRGMRTADALGGDIGMAYELADPNAGRVLDARRLRSVFEKNPAAQLPGAPSAMIREGIDPVTGQRKSSALDSMMNRGDTTAGERPATGPKPLMNIKQPTGQNDTQSLTNKILKSLSVLGRSPMID